MVQGFSTGVCLASTIAKNREKLLINTPYLLAKTFAATNKSSIISAANDRVDFRPVHSIV